jgi:hypothetical protein
MWRKHLTWTHRLYENHASSEFAEKVNEMYMVFAELSQTEGAVLALQRGLKKSDLRNIPGENVDKAFSLARATIILKEYCST